MSVRKEVVHVFCRSEEVLLQNTEENNIVSNVEERNTRS